MSRRRQTERFWVHSDPETQPRTAPEAEQATPCPGQCNIDYRAAMNERKDELEAAACEHRRPDPEIVNHGVIPRLGNPIWCSLCQSDIRAAIGQLDDLAAYVSEREDGKIATGIGIDTGPQHTKGSHSPSGSPAWDAVDEAITWANDTAHSLALRLGHAWRPRTRRDGDPARNRLLAPATNYLYAWCPQLLSQPKAEKWGKEALSLASRLRRASGRDELVMRLTMACPTCNLRALERADGSNTVACRSCQAILSLDDYETLVETFKVGQATKRRTGDA